MGARELDPGVARASAHLPVPRSVEGVVWFLRGAMFFVRVGHKGVSREMGSARVRDKKK
jgi:hypothetical protein